MAVELTLCREALHCRISHCLPSPWSVHVQKELLDPTAPAHAESAAKTTELTAKCSGMWDIHYKMTAEFKTTQLLCTPCGQLCLMALFWRCQSRILRKTIRSSRVLDLKVIFALKNRSISRIYLSTFSCTSWSRYITASWRKCKYTHALKGYSLPTVLVKTVKKTDPKDSAKQHKNTCKLPSSRK